MKAAVLDIEVMPNWTYAMCVSKSGNVVYEYECWADEPPTERGKVPGSLITFNGLHYDLPILAAIKAGMPPGEVHEVSAGIIEGEGPYKTLKAHGLTRWKPNWHMDTQAIRLGPPGAGLKLRAARLHVPHLEEMPVDPTKPISRRKAKATKEYCHSDCMATWHIVNKFMEVGIIQTHASTPVTNALEKTPSACAEQLWAKRAKPGRNPPPQDVKSATGYKVLPTPRMTPELRALHGRVDGSRFVWEIGHLDLQFGMGGLHSVDKPMVVRDVMFADVSSYYTSVLIQLAMNHPRLVDFAGQLEEMRSHRLRMKAEGVQTPVEKLLLNTCSGKLGDQYSVLYAPDIYKSMTLSGQYLMAVLAAMVTRAGLKVYSVNTDGIVCDAMARGVCQDWADAHKMPIEFDDIDTYAARDVSTYVARGTDGSLKYKGAFMPPMDLKDMVRYGTKNPQGTIIYRAAAKALLECEEWRDAAQVIAETIQACDDVREYIFVRLVRGGATQRGRKIGSVARWVNVTSGGTGLRTASGGRVPASSGAQLVPDLNDFDISAIDRRWYEDQAIELWSNIKGKGSLL